MPPFVYTETKADAAFLSLNGSYVLGLSLSEGRVSLPESEEAEEGLDFTPENSNKRLNK